MAAQGNRSAWRRAAALAGLLGGWLPLAALAAPTAVTVAVVSQPGDARYAPRRLEQAYPGHPQGRPLAAARMAAEDAGVELEVLGLSLKVIELSVADAQALPAALAQLKATGVRHVLADLPAPALGQLVQLAPAALGGAMVFNIGLEEDALRGEQCAAHLLHTLPS
ncbi:MAG: amino acid/amide transporter substrate-binding protein family, partial [Polaromonas sp.]|nr:amino acid/amide transporter substrate-binding protein family [Polaromonas sp.]